MNYNESSSGSSSPGSSRPASPPPGTPSEDSGLNQLRALTDQVASEQAINQLAERLDASFGNQEPEQIPGQRMANYDKQTGVDAASALEKACNGLKGYEFDEQDLGFYFNQVELQRETGKFLTENFIHTGFWWLENFGISGMEDFIHEN